MGWKPTLLRVGGILVTQCRLCGQQTKDALWRRLRLLHADPLQFFYQ